MIRHGFSRRGADGSQCTFGQCQPDATLLLTAAWGIDRNGYPVGTGCSVGVNRLGQGRFIAIPEFPAVLRGFAGTPQLELNLEGITASCGQQESNLIRSHREVS